MPPERPLRIAMVLFNQVGRGTYFRAIGFARGLVARGHRVTVLAMSRHERLRIVTSDLDGVELVQFPDWLWGPLRSGWDPVETLARIGWLRGRSFDIVHAFESRPTVIFPALFAARMGATLLMDWCDWFGSGGSVEMRPNPLVRAVLRPVESWFEEHFRCHAVGTTVINTVLQQKAVALGVEPESILLLPNGADAHRLRPIPRDEARQALGLDRSRPMIGYVGSAFPDDLALMGAAFERIHALRPEIQLLRLGQHTYPLAPHLHASQAVLEPEGWLTDEELNLYMAACDLFWLPIVNVGANRGRMPAKLTDYLCIGRPIVATRVGDVESLFEEERLGRLADDRPEDVAEQTLLLLDEGRERHRSYGATAQRLVRERFDWERLAARLEQHYIEARGKGLQPGLSGTPSTGVL